MSSMPCRIHIGGQGLLELVDRGSTRDTLIEVEENDDEDEDEDDDDDDHDPPPVTPPMMAEALVLCCSKRGPPPDFAELPSRVVPYVRNRSQWECDGCHRVVRKDEFLTLESAARLATWSSHDGSVVWARAAIS